MEEEMRIRIITSMLSVAMIASIVGDYEEEAEERRMFRMGESKAAPSSLARGKEKQAAMEKAERHATVRATVA